MSEEMEKLEISIEPDSTQPEGITECDIDGDDSLEPGEVVDDKTPPRNDDLSYQGLELNCLDKKQDHSSDDDFKLLSGISPTKPVFGKEKAKRRLKALGIQKQIQLMSKNMKTPIKKMRSDLGRNLKKDKPPTAHEKAKLTKDAIEKMKNKEDRAIPCLYYDEAMIHHIQVENLEQKSYNKNDTSSTNISPLEAIKTYADRDDEMKAERSMMRDRRIDEDKFDKALTNRKLMYDDFNRRPYMRKRLERPGGHRMRPFDNRMMTKGPDRDRIGFKRPSKDYQRYSFNRNNSNMNRFPPKVGATIMFTKKKPSISYAFNEEALLAAKQKPEKLSSRKDRKLKKKSKKLRDPNYKRQKKRKRYKSKTEDSNERNERSERSERRKKKKRSAKIEKDDDNDDGDNDGNGNNNQEKKKKRKKRRASDRPERINKPALSFLFDDYMLPEDDNSFQLCKDGVNVSEEVEDKKVKETEEKHDASGKKTPDTDDYMGNWEEDEYLIQSPIRKEAEATPKSVKAGDGGNDEDNGLNSKRNDDDNEEIVDGLGTPIFVNPSPPEEFVANKRENDSPSVGVNVADKATIRKEVTEIITKPKAMSTPLFGMQILYEQFIQSVNEAGIDLSVEGSENAKAGLIDDISRDTVQPNDKRDAHNVERSLTPEVTSTKTLSDEFKTQNDNNDNNDKQNDLESNSSSSNSSTSSSTSSSSSSTTSSSSSTSSEEYGNDDVGSSTSKLRKKIKKKKSSPVNPLNEFLAGDLTKLTSLKKRWKMLKSLQNQTEGLDDEDRQCLLGLQNLIEAEKGLVMRKYDLHDLDLSSSDEKDDADTEIKGKSAENDSAMFDAPKLDDNQVKNDEDPHKIFDINRETIKLTITRSNDNSLEKVTQDEDQDFTEKLLKTKENSPNINREESTDRKSCDYTDNRNSNSPDSSRKISKRPSTSPSPRNRNHGSSDKRIRKRQYGTSPKWQQQRNDSPRRKHDSKRSRDSRRSLSPAHRRRSRSPPYRRSSRSPGRRRSPNRRSRSRTPPFRPPSPPCPPPRDSRSVSEERIEKFSPRTNNTGNINQQYYQYYPANNAFYYNLPQPNQRVDNRIDLQHNGGAQVDQRSYETGYNTYTGYNSFSNEYSTGEQAENYSQNFNNQYINPEPAANNYSNIPVINSCGANYYYNEFMGEQANSHLLNDNITNPRNNKDIMHKNGTNNNKSTFAVQKGNVLEIVPASVIPKEEFPSSSSSSSTTTSSITPSASATATVTATATTIDDRSKNQLEEFKAEKCIELFDIKKENGEKKKQTKVIRSWEDEVAKRHIMAAVLRLNKEEDGNLRGILYTSANTNEAPRPKKKVLFADGIEPGNCSSADDGGDTPTRTRRKALRKKRRKTENKENEMGPFSLDMDIKIDPELENMPAPLPPPGSPSVHLEQPILTRPPSPEELLYFHFDGLVNAMYVSLIAEPIPPRLLNRPTPPGQQMNNPPSLLPLGTHQAPVSNKSSFFNSYKTLHMRSTYPVAPLDPRLTPFPSPSPNSDSNGSVRKTNNSPKDLVIPPQMHHSITPTPKEPPLQSGELLSPPLYKGNSPKPVDGASPQNRTNSPPPNKVVAMPRTKRRNSVHSMWPNSPRTAAASPSPSISPLVRPVSPSSAEAISPRLSSITANFNRPQRPMLTSPSPTSTALPDFSFPPPAPAQQFLSHPSIPFGPRPPGGSANLNRLLPPPFSPSSSVSFKPHESSQQTFQPPHSMELNVCNTPPNIVPGNDSNVVVGHPQNYPVPPRPPHPMQGYNPQNMNPNMSPMPYNTTSMPPHRPGMFPRHPIGGPVPGPLHPHAFNQRMSIPGQHLTHPHLQHAPHPHMQTPRGMFTHPGGVHQFFRSENISLDRSTSRVPPSSIPENRSPRNSGKKR